MNNNNNYYYENQEKKMDHGDDNNSSCRGNIPSDLNSKIIEISTPLPPPSSVRIMMASEETLNDQEIDLITKKSKKSISNGGSDDDGKNPNNNNNNNVKKKRERPYWADCARIYSTVAIILLHCAGNGCEKTLLKRNDPSWIIVCCYNCITRFGVPMFVLLSGTFILDPSRAFSFKKLFRHNILRLATAFTFWSTLNALLNIYLYKKNKPSDFLKLFFVGEEYLWFIFMIIGCYLISPILRLFSDNIVLARYFLGLCVFWGSFLPTLNNIFTSFQFKDAQEELTVWTNRWHYHFTLEFVGYFVAGYHIVKHVSIKSLKIRLILYLLCLADVVLYTRLTYNLENANKKRYSKEFRDNYTLTVAFYTVVLFIFFKHEIGRIQFSRRAIKVITKVSSLTFGMYLSHMILKIVLSRYFHIKQEEFLGIKYSAKIGCPIFAVVITILSLLISYLLSITPILKNYVV
jgi:surface polysaccharide O-acyltransferase-like enzyme